LVLNYENGILYYIKEHNDGVFLLNISNTYTDVCLNFNFVWAYRKPLISNNYETNNIH